MNHTIIKVVQATHHQGDVRYDVSRGIQCFYMSVISVSWTLFKSPGLWDKFDFDSILGKVDQFHCLNQFQRSVFRKYLFDRCCEAEISNSA